MMAEDNQMKEGLENNVVIIAIASTGIFEPNFDPEIVQLTLAKPDGTKLFSQHVLPQGSFQKEASHFNGFTVETVDDKRRLMRHGEVITAYPLEKVLKEFHDVISSFCDQVQGRLLLVGYFCHDFDIQLLMKELTKCGISGEIFSQMNVVFADIYWLVRYKRDDLLPYHGGNLKMTTVYNVLCGAKNPHQHDAIEDAHKLGAIYSKIEGLIDKQTFERFVFSVNEEGIQELGVTAPLRRRSIKRNTDGDTAKSPEGPARKKPNLK